MVNVNKPRQQVVQPKNSLRFLFHGNRAPAHGNRAPDPYEVSLVSLYNG